MQKSTMVWPAPSRNALCTCGSGKRYKHCCGALGASGSEANNSPAPTDAHAIGTTMSRALAEQQRGNLNAASNLYRSVLSVEPENIEALHKLGVIHSIQGNLDEAERLMRRADSLCVVPVPVIQADLGMLLQKIYQLIRYGGFMPPLELVEIVDIKKLSDIATEINEVYPPQEITLPELTMEKMGYFPDSYIVPEQKSVFPAIKTFVLENAIVDAQSSIPATENIVILDSHVDLSRHHPPEWRWGVYLPGSENSSIKRRVGMDCFNHPVLPSAIVLTSVLWVNWSHFLTEILPKALIADRHPDWRDWPMLISSVGLASAQELLKLLVSPDRRIIKTSGRVRLERAGYVSSVGFCPLEYEYDQKTELPQIHPTDCIYSPHAFDLIRSAVSRLIQPAVSTDSPFLYVRRNSSVRKFTNQDEVEQYFRSRGFQIISPENLSAYQQVELFSRAKIIAGPNGSALANIVFAPPGCQILVLAAINRHWPFHYWLNMGHAAGFHVRYLFGEAVGQQQHPAHSDLFFDDISRLGAAIDTAIKEVRG